MTDIKSENGIIKTQIKQHYCGYEDGYTQHYREKFSYTEGYFVSDPHREDDIFDGDSYSVWDIEKHPRMEDALDRYQSEGVELVDGVLVSKKECLR